MKMKKKKKRKEKVYALGSVGFRPRKGEGGAPSPWEPRRWVSPPRTSSGWGGAISAISATNGFLQK